MLPWAGPGAKQSRDTVDEIEADISGDPCRGQVAKRSRPTRALGLKQSQVRHERKAIQRRTPGGRVDLMVGMRSRTLPFPLPLRRITRSGARRCGCGRLRSGTARGSKASASAILHPAFYEMASLLSLYDPGPSSRFPRGS